MKSQKVPLEFNQTASCCHLLATRKSFAPALFFFPSDAWPLLLDIKKGLLRFAFRADTRIPVPFPYILFRFLSIVAACKRPRICSLPGPMLFRHDGVPRRVFEYSPARHRRHKSLANERETIIAVIVIVVTAVRERIQSISDQSRVTWSALNATNVQITKKERVYRDRGGKPFCSFMRIHLFIYLFIYLLIVRYLSRLSALFRRRSERWN